MCTFHSGSDSFKQRLKNHPLLHALCTNAHRLLRPPCMGILFSEPVQSGGRGEQAAAAAICIGVDVRVVTSSSEQHVVCDEAGVTGHFHPCFPSLIYQNLKD